MPTLTATPQSRHLANREVPMMDRRIFLTTVAGLLAAPLAVEAQQAGTVGISTYRSQCAPWIVTTERGIE